MCKSTENIVLHHKSYNPEITQYLCRSCHGKIHSEKKIPKNFHYLGKTSISIGSDLRLALDDYRRKQRRIPTVSHAINKLLWYALDKIKQNEIV